MEGGAEDKAHVLKHSLTSKQVETHVSESSQRRAHKDPDKEIIFCIMRR